MTKGERVAYHDYRAGCRCDQCLEYEKTLQYAGMRLEASFLNILITLLRPTVNRLARAIAIARGGGE